MGRRLMNRRDPAGRLGRSAGSVAAGWHPWQSAVASRNRPGRGGIKWKRGIVVAAAHPGIPAVLLPCRRGAGAGASPSPDPPPLDVAPEAPPTRAGSRSGDAVRARAAAVVTQPRVVVRTVEEPVYVVREVPARPRRRRSPPSARSPSRSRSDPSRQPKKPPGRPEGRAARPRTRSRSPPSSRPSRSSTAACSPSRASGSPSSRSAARSCSPRRGGSSRG